MRMSDTENRLARINSNPGRAATRQGGLKARRMRKLSCVNYFNTKCASPKTARFEKSLFSKRRCVGSPRIAFEATSKVWDSCSTAIRPLLQVTPDRRTSAKTIKLCWKPSFVNLSQRKTMAGIHHEKTRSYQCGSAQQF